MTIARREMLALLGSALTCSFSSIAFAATARTARIALLAPLSGPNAGLGRSMLRAAALLQGKDKDKPILIDTAGSDGADGAASRALKQGAEVIVGPLFAEDTRAVMAVVGTRIPVLSLSNDPALRDGGAFILGITPQQATGAILDYARSRGVRRVAIVAPGGDSSWAQSVAAEARRLQAMIGIEADMMTGAMVQAGENGPDAVLITDGGPEALALARQLRGAGVQCLATLQSLDGRPEALTALDGAWLAAPDPAAFNGFARSYAMQGDDAGLTAALAYDGVSIARQLGMAGPVDRSAVLGLPRFAGATGNLRFRGDGGCIREMAILLARSTGFETVDHRAAA